MNTEKDLVICVYDENGVSVSEKILEAFEKYLKLTLQNSKS